MYLSTVLSSLDEARRTAGILRMDVVLDLTHSPPKQLRVPHGLNVTHVLHSLSVRHGLAGQHRPRYARALAGGGYDYYAFLSNDANVTAAALDALCAWQAPLAGTNLMVGLLRWESKRDDIHSHKLLNDQAFGPQLGGVVTIGGRRFLVPTNPHTAAWFLPAKRLRCVLGALAASNESQRDWTVEPRADASLEYYEALWLKPWFIKVVPFDAYYDLLAHHLSNKYAQTTRIPMPDASSLYEAAKSFTGFEPVSLPVLRRWT
jgi:hypothetical protein